MTNFEVKKNEWNKQAADNPESTAQVARAMNEEDLNALVADIEHKLLLNKTGSSILDMGCGNGYILSHLKQHFSEIYGVDYAEVMVEEARKIIPEGQFQCGPAHEQMFGEKKFSRILCYSIFHYFPDHDYAEGVIRNMIDMCEPQGVILIGDLLNKDMEATIKGGSDLSYEKKIPSIHRYSEWTFYNLEKLAAMAEPLSKKVEILDQPESFKMQHYRKDLRICL